MQNERKWEGKPLASHLSYHFLKRAVIHRETPLHKCSVLAHICCLQLLQRNQSVKTQDTRPRRQHLQCIYEWPENWAWGQIPCNSGAYLQLELDKTTRGKPLVHLFPCRDTYTTFSPCSQQQGCSTSPELCHVSPFWWPAGTSGISSSPIWGQWKQQSHANTSSGLPFPSTCMRSAPQ